VNFFHHSEAHTPTLAVNKQHAIELNLVLGNSVHQQSDLPPEEKVMVDLGL
jgi:hypothetical protein